MIVAKNRPGVNSLTTALLLIFVSGCVGVPNEPYPLYAYGHAPGENPELNRLSSGSYDLVGIRHPSVPPYAGLRSFTAHTGRYGYHGYGYPLVTPGGNPNPNPEPTLGPANEIQLPPVDRGSFAPPTRHLPEPRKPVRRAPPHAPVVNRLRKPNRHGSVRPAAPPVRTNPTSQISRAGYNPSRTPAQTP